GQSAGDFSVAYFASLIDAHAFSNQLADDYTLTPGVTTIYAVVKSLSGGCSAIANFTLRAYANPIAEEITDFEMCDGIVRDRKAEFDLDAKTDEILNGQTGIDVKYYETEERAQTA